MFRVASQRLTQRGASVLSSLRSAGRFTTPTRQSTTDATSAVLQAPTRQQSTFGRLWARYQECLATRPLLTNACTTAVLASAADAGAQKIEGGSMDAPVSLKRCLTTASFNVAISPMLRGWFLLLEKIFPAKATWSVISGKIIVNQSVISPICNSLFFGWVIFARDGFSEQSLDAYKTKVSEDLIPTQKAAWAMWVPANLINFGFVPLQHRVLYLNVVATFWTCFLSMQAYRKRQALPSSSTNSSVVIEEIVEEEGETVSIKPALSMA